MFTLAYIALAFIVGMAVEWFRVNEYPMWKLRMFERKYFGKVLASDTINPSADERSKKIGRGK